MSIWRVYRIDVWSNNMYILNISIFQKNVITDFYFCFMTLNSSEMDLTGHCLQISQQIHLSTIPKGINPRGHIDWRTKPCHPRRPAGPSPHWANAASRWYEAMLQGAMQGTFRIHEFTPCNSWARQKKNERRRKSLAYSKWSFVRKGKALFLVGELLELHLWWKWNV